MANQHIILPYNTTSGAVPSAYSASTEGDSGIKAGELAVNLYQGQEFLVTRNENGDIIKFSSDNLALFEKGSGANSIQQKGTNCTASGDKSFAMGDGATASGYCAYAEGSQTSGSGNYSHAEGADTTASGMGSHAEGNQTKTFGDDSHAEGYGTTTSGNASHAEGKQTSALTEAAHAEGNTTLANGKYSHTEGNATSATSQASHSEGSYSVASGSSSHAEGFASNAYGDYSHSEGSTSVASGSSSHAEGSGTRANGVASHSEGYGTKANGKAEHASGIYNVSHDSGATAWNDLQGTTSSTVTVSAFTGASTLFSVGFGEDSATTRNAFEITDKGQVVLNSRKTYFRYGDTSAAIGDNDFAATGATQYPEQDGVAEYVTMFDVIEKVREGDNYAVFEKGSGANSVQQKGTDCVASGTNSVAIGSGTTARFSNEFVCGVYNEVSNPRDGAVLFSIGNGSSANRANSVLIKKSGQILPELPTNHVEAFVYGDLHNGKLVSTRTVSANTGNYSLSAVTSGISVQDSVMFINNNTYSGGNNSYMFISSGSTMMRGQTVTLYFTKPMVIGGIETETEGAFPEIISNVKVYYHIGGSVDVADDALMNLGVYSFTVAEITKLKNRAADSTEKDEYVIEFRNVKDTAS